MRPTNPHAVLIAHDRWANQQLYAACDALSNDQFHHTFAMGTGSIHNNLIHNLGAMRRWTDVLNESEPHARLEEKRHTLAEIRELHDAITAEFEHAALRRPFDTVIEPMQGATAYTFTVGGILAHVITHSTHHRAQCLNMLRQLGIEQHPMSSVMEWMLVADA